MMSDEELEHTRRIALGTGSKHTLDLLDEIARLRAEVERCHERLEINHRFVFSRDPEVADLVRVEIPYESRELSDDMDGIMSRDLTIRAMEEEIAELDGELAVVRADLERSQSEHRHTMHVMDGMQDEIVGLRAMVESAEANAKLHFEAAEDMRAENEKLRAARLRPETVEIIRRALDFYYGKSMELPPAFRGGDYNDVPVALADLSRAYPEEE